MSQTAAFHADYRAALERHLEGPGEGTLQQAYEMGRRALASRLGLLELTLVHLDAARALDTDGPERRRRAEAFLLESLTPFEMTHRAFREATLALRRLNERVEDEAKRIAHALHDEAGALLATAHIAVEEVASTLPSGRRGGFARIREILVEIEKELRRLSHELRPTILDDLGLLPALDFLTKGVAGRTGLAIRVEGSVPGRLPPAVETTLYRAVQEALNNVVRHAHAGEVLVSVRRDHAMVRCQVKDNGVGFDAGHPSHDGPERGLGLVGIQERIDSLHGTLRVLSTPGHGTELTMSLPLEV
jgi:signal transduction histidine kinase